MRMKILPSVVRWSSATSPRPPSAVAPVAGAAQSRGDLRKTPRVARRFGRSARAPNRSPGLSSASHDAWDTIGGRISPRPGATIALRRLIESPTTNRVAPSAPRLSSTTFYRSSLRDETIKRYSLCGAPHKCDNLAFTAEHVVTRKHTRFGQQRKSSARWKPSGSVDWGHCGRIQIGGTWRSVSVFVVVLCYSRMCYVEFCLSQRKSEFYRSLVHALEFFKAVHARSSSTISTPAASPWTCSATPKPRPEPTPPTRSTRPEQGMNPISLLQSLISTDFDAWI